MIKCFWGSETHPEAGRPHARTAPQDRRQGLPDPELEGPAPRTNRIPAGKTNPVNPRLSLSLSRSLSPISPACKPQPALSPAFVRCYDFAASLVFHVCMLDFFVSFFTFFAMIGDLCERNTEFKAC